LRRPANRTRRTATARAALCLTPQCRLYADPTVAQTLRVQDRDQPVQRT